MSGIVLYQPESVLQKRAPPAQSWADYIRALQSTCTVFLRETGAQEAPDVFVALKPGRRSRIWFISSTPAAAGLLEPLRGRLERIEAPEVRGGPVTFLFAAAPGGTARGHPEPRLPDEWLTAIRESGREFMMVPDEVLAIVWPDPE